MNKIFTFVVMTVLTFLLYACGGGGGSAGSTGTTDTVAALFKNSTAASTSAVAAAMPIGQ